MSQYDLGRAVGMRNKGSSINEIARELGRSHNGIKNSLVRTKSRNSTKRKEGTGRKNKKTTVRQDLEIIKQVRGNKRSTTSVEIQKKLNFDISTGTIRNRIHQYLGFKSHWALKKPQISTKNRSERLKFAKEHENWSVEDWKKVIWSDESPFMIKYRGRKRIWRAPNERCFFLHFPSLLQYFSFLDIIHGACREPKNMTRRSMFGVVSAGMEWESW